MNKNIKQFQDMADTYAHSKADFTDEDWEFQWDRDYNQKFAELIINECLAACDSALNTQWLIYPTSDRVINDCKKLIRARFDISE
jgi:hypothetical protein